VVYVCVGRVYECPNACIACPFLRRLGKIWEACVRAPFYFPFAPVLFGAEQICTIPAPQNMIIWQSFSGIISAGIGTFGML